MNSKKHALEDFFCAVESGDLKRTELYLDDYP